VTHFLRHVTLLIVQIILHIPNKFIPTTTKAEARVTSREKDTIQTIVQASPNFQVTFNMLQMDEIVAQTPLKDLAQVELVTIRILTKALYKPQFSVM
jgi:hypothetical protein